MAEVNYIGCDHCMDGYIYKTETGKYICGKCGIFYKIINEGDLP